MRRSISPKVLLAVALAVLGPVFSTEAASPALIKLLKVLKDRGTLTAQEYEDLVLAA